MTSVFLVLMLKPKLSQALDKRFTHCCISSSVLLLRAQSSAKRSSLSVATFTFLFEGAVSPAVGRSLITPAARVCFPDRARIIRCKNLTLNIRDCESLCLSDETLQAVGPFYLVSMPGEVKYPTHGVNV